MEAEHLKMKENRRVVVTGMGGCTPIGNGKEVYWEALLRGTNGVDKIKAFDTSKFKNHNGAEVKDFNPCNYMSENNSKKIGRASQFAVASTKMAIDDAGLKLDEVNLNKIGVILGATIGEGYVTKKINTNIINAGISSVPDDLPCKYPSWIIPANVAIEFGFRGPNMMIPTACAAGNYTLGRAFDLIKSNTADIIFAGGSDALSFGAYAGFNRSMAMAPVKVQPFDKNRKGMIIGEGAGVLLLESLEHAEKRNANIVAELIGYGFGCDAYHMVTPSPDGRGIIIAMNSALKMAGIQSDSIQYISAHGTGTNANDKAETSAIKRVFGDNAYNIPVSSIKSMIGHPMGAASALEAIACCMIVKNNVVTPTINYEEKDPECDLDYIPNKAREVKVDYAMSNALAFGGNNACVIFKKYTD